MRYLVIENSVVTNIIMAPQDFTLPGSALVADEGQAQIGWTRIGGIFVAPAAPPPAPPTLDEARAECARRIVIDASESAQLNLNAYMNLLGFKPSLSPAEQADAATFAQLVAWIAAMRATWKALQAAGDVNYSLDAKWPACPQAVQDLVARF